MYTSFVQTDVIENSQQKHVYCKLYNARALGSSFPLARVFAITSLHRIPLAAPEHISNSKAMRAIVEEMCNP
jgi:hypothetical protein